MISISKQLCLMTQRHKKDSSDMIVEFGPLDGQCVAMLVIRKVKVVVVENVWRGHCLVLGESACVVVVINWRPVWRLDSAVDRSILVLSVRKWHCCHLTNTGSGRMSGARERERECCPM